MPTYIITGRITDQRSEPLEGFTVRAYDKDPIFPDDIVGEAATDDDGRYRIKFDATRMRTGGRERRGPHVYIRVFDGEQRLADSPVRDNAGASISIDLTVNPPAEPERPEDPEPFAGLLAASDGCPIAAAKVLAFHNTLCAEQLLGKAITDAGACSPFPTITQSAQDVRV